MLLAVAPVLANDTSAVLTTGGLEFITNQDIVMESEELFISKDEIRVVYQFRNDGDVDPNILVAFPMPDIRSEEHTSELQSLKRISYDVFCLKTKKFPTK